jgi:DNA adenine methylase
MKMRTPLTFYGGKQRLAAQIVSYMPPHLAYLEPFAGGAAVLFAKSRAERETLNDLDGEVVRFWRALRDRPAELALAVEATPYSRAEWEGAADDEVEDDVEAARRFLVRLEQSFGRTRTSWARPSLNPDFRARWQGHTWGNVPDRLLAAVDRLSGVVLERGDAINLIPAWDTSGALIYCDPPYTGEHRVAKEHRYAHDDDGTLWPRLVDALLAVEHACVLLSGYPCEEAERLTGWRSIELRARTNMPLRGKTGSAPETLWLSPAVPEPIPDLLSGAAA